MTTDEQTQPVNPELAPLDELVSWAWKIGNAIDLTGVGYGRIHWDNFRDIITDPLPYYFFLAGFVRLVHAARICEIGTHWGGSTLALRRGVSPELKPDVVTIDLSRKSRFDAELGIRKIIGEAGSKVVLQTVAEHFDEQAHIDLLFIDSHHTFAATFSQYCEYTTLLRPRFVILDDISLNEEMANAWQLILRSVPPGQALDASEVVREIRDGPGLAVVRLQQNFGQIAGWSKAE